MVLHEKVVSTPPYPSSTRLDPSVGENATEYQQGEVVGIRLA